MNRQALKEILDNAAGMPPGERSRYLDQACAGDGALRDEASSLLSAHDHAPRFLTSPTAGPDWARLDSAGMSATGLSAGAGHAAGATIGPYRLLERLGEGGFGEVWLAEQHEPVRRRVALKIIKAGMDSQEVLARFGAERQALALIDHPNVAKVFDAGQSDSGRPYFVMEHVAGVSVTDYCDASRLRIRQRLEVFVEICHAVQHAHSKGIIHRDLKPSNILVTLLDGKPLPKVIDFGIAKATTTPLTDRTRHTELGRLMGTPEYMSPEQAATSGVDVDTRGDIYSLGVILYQLLTGTLPFDPQTLRKLDHSSLIQHIREQEPATPSSRLSTLGAAPVNQRGAAPRDIAARRSVDFTALQRQIRGELDWIVMKCLEKDRGRRYETANGLAMDIARHLRHEPVLAGPPSRLYRVRKFVRRNRAMVTAAAIVAAALLAGMGGTTYGLLRAEQRRAEAEAARKQTEQVSEFQAAMLSGIDVEAMGRGIKEQFRQQVRAALERQYVGEFPDRRKRTPEEIEAELAAFDERAGAAQAADVARRVMDEFVLARAADALEQKFADQPLVQAELHDAIGNTYRKLGLYAAAEPHFTTALEITRRVLGDDHPNTLASITNLGVLLDTHKKHAEAEPFFREALEKYRRVLGDEHPHTVNAIFNLGFVLREQGKLTEAEPYVRKALEVSRRTLGDDDPKTLGSLSNMGGLLQAQDKLDEAEAYMRAALEGRRRVQGSEHPDTLAAIHNLGNLLESQRRFSESESCYREALEGRRRVLGDEHPETMISIDNMGRVLKIQGKWIEAEPYCREALEGLRRALGDDHPDTLIALSNLADLLHYQGKLAAAERLSRETLEARRRVLGDEDRATLESMNNMAYVLRDLGRWAEAQALFAEATRVAQARLGDNAFTAMIEHHYADVLLQVGRREEALTLAQSALDRYLAHPDWSPREAEHARQVLVAALGAAGRQAEAITLQRELVETTRQRYGGQDPRVAECLAGLAGMVVEQEGYPAAEPLYTEALEIYRRAYGDKHELIARILNNMAVALWSSDRAATERLLREVIAIRRALRGADAELSLTLNDLAWLLVDRGDYAAAEPLYREALAMQRELLGSKNHHVAHTLTNLTRMLMQKRDYAAAVPLLRELLEIHEELLPPGSSDHWLVAESRGMLGGALAGQAAALTESDAPTMIAEFTAAEPLLVDAGRWLIENSARIPQQVRAETLNRALERIVALYEAWDRVAPESGMAVQVLRWRAELEKLAGP